MEIEKWKNYKMGRRKLAEALQIEGEICAVAVVEDGTVAFMVKEPTQGVSEGKSG